MTSKFKIKHEEYHIDTSIQKKIIKPNNFTYRHLIKTIDEYLRPGMKILDIGCGAGTLDFYYAKKGYEVTGIDISQNAIDCCIKSAQYMKINNCKFLNYNFMSNKINAKFDFIIFTEVIEHLPNDGKALEKIYDLLNNEGYLFLTTPLKSAPLTKLGLTNTFDYKVGHLRRYSEIDIVKKIKDSKLKIIHIQKNEGILRNFLYTNNYAGKTVRYFKFFISDLITFLDNLSQKLFGYSNIFIISKKLDKKIN